MENSEIGNGKIENGKAPILRDKGEVWGQPASYDTLRNYSSNK